MDGVKIGHFSNPDEGTGVSVFLFEDAGSAAYIQAGSAPATHELAVLEPESVVATVHGLCLSGGSAFGLFAAKGVVEYLNELGIGFEVKHGIVPIVPAAALYDLSYKAAKAPSAEDAYEACKNAVENNYATGQIGAGTGATVGKLIPHAFPMTGGLGRASIQLADGLEVTAYAVVNSVGDICDDRHRILAGAVNERGTFMDATQYLLRGQAEHDLFLQGNTSLVVVLTNAFFVKDELKRISKMAIAGMARAISPVFTCYDGDILFSVSVGDHQASEMTVGTIAAEAVRLAVINAIKESTIVKDAL